MTTLLRNVLRPFYCNGSRILTSRHLGNSTNSLKLTKIVSTSSAHSSHVRLNSNHSVQKQNHPIDPPRLFATCKISNDDSIVSVNWKDDLSCDYPLIYLRDNCRCKSCFDSTTEQRMLETVFEIDIKNLTAEKISISEDASQLIVKWNDGHLSKYDSTWLGKRIFPKKGFNTAKFGIQYPTSTWGGELNGNIPMFDMQRMKTNDSELLDWLETLSTKGLAIVTNTKPAEGEVKQLREIVGAHARCTNYGDIFTVKSKSNPSNLAYTVGNLLLHTDLPFYKSQPGIQILHFIKHRVAYGGENHLVDGFHVANTLKKEKPELFDILTEVNFEYYDYGSDAYGEFHMQNERPAIELNKYGEVDSVAVNNHVRGTFVNAPTEFVQRAYEAVYALYEIAYREENLVTHKCEEGDMLTFNNRRVMHGRAAYNPDAAGGRLMEGCYFDWDEANSKIRRLRQKLGMGV